jgi:uncharacterized protein
MATQSPHNLNNEREPLAVRLFLGPDGRVRPTLRAISFGVVLFIASAMASAFAGALQPNATLWWQLFWGSTALLATGLVVSLFFLRVGEGKGFCDLGLCFRGAWAKQLAIGIALGLMLQGAIVAMLFATRSLRYTPGTLTGGHAWLKLLGDVWLLAAAATFEEVAFRGYALRCLQEAWGPAAAVAATSMVFGLMHLGNPSASIFSTVNTFLAGIMMAIPYVRTRQMWTQSGLHWAWNFFMGPIFSLNVSGILFRPNVFSSHEAGAVWWTGGSYGPEGGAVSTVVIIAGILWLARSRLFASSTRVSEAVE